MTIGPVRAAPEAHLLIEASTGKVLEADNATYPWYPASVTKLMTTYVTLQAVRQGRITFDTLLTVSPRAAAQQPSKMGFKPGTQLTVDNALKMLLVKSANDIAVVLAEGVSDSVEKFAEEMNATSHRLGMTQSSWVNPNGLPAENQITSARDLGILARALIHDFPEYDYYWHVPGIKFGKRVMRNYNTLLGRYAGADGMKTGFICASGFNLVATATRHSRRLIAIVLGAQSSPVRAVKAAMLLEHGFNNTGLSWLKPSLGLVNALPAINSAPPDLRDEMCGPHRKRPAAEALDDEADATTTGDRNTPIGFILSSVTSSHIKPSELLSPPGAIVPVTVFIGPSRKSADTQIAHTGPGKPNLATAVPRLASVPTPAQTQPVMSFAPATRTNETPPLTAVPAVTAQPRLAAVPMPRPKPRLKPKKRAASR